MPSFSRCAAVLLGLQLLCPMANAVVLTLDPIQSTVVVEIVALGGCPSCDVIDTLAFSGTIDASVFLREDPTEGTVVGNMQIGSGDLALTDGSWLVPAGYIFVDVDTVDVGGTMASPFTVGIAVSPQTSELELQGSMLTLNEGMLTGFVEDISDVTYQLGVDPMSFSFDSTALATATATERDMQRIDDANLFSKNFLPQFQLIVDVESALMDAHRNALQELGPGTVD